MRALSRVVTVTVAALLALAVPAGSASAAPICAGTTNTAVVCVEPNGFVAYTDCVVVVSPPCMPVTVYAPTITIYCGTQCWPVKWWLDPVICPLIQAFSPGVPPYVYIDGQSDVSGLVEWDCPPYEV